MVWGLVTFLFGIAYGWFTPGRQDKWSIFKTGILIGIVLALVLALIGFLTGIDPLGFGLTYLGLFLTVVILSVLFVVGVWLGDVLEGANRRRRVA